MSYMKSFVFAIFLLVILASNSYGQSVYSILNSEFSDLTFEVSTEKELYLLYEPIKVLFSISNKKDYEVMGSLPSEFDQRYMSLIIYHNGTATETYELLGGVYTTDCAFHFNRPINPGFEMKFEESLIYGIEKKFFEPGSYKLQFVLKNRAVNSTEMLRSNIVSIEVHRPD